MDLITQNTLRAIRFERPDHVPMVFWISPACWHHYRPEVLFELMADHPLLFPDFSPTEAAIAEPAPWERADRPYTDAWGCLWQTADDGITGTVTQHPLADWEDLTHFVAPDSTHTNGMTEIDWPAERCQALDARRTGKYCSASLEHGHTFQRLCYLRGYENLLLDMADGNEQLRDLVDTVEAFNLSLVQRYLDLGAAMLCYPEDLGMQKGPMLSPTLFHAYIRPVYERLTAPARKEKCLVHMHSDGDIRDLAEDLLASGIDALNLQDLVNGVEWIAAHLKSRVCIDLDIDRQQITPFASPSQIDALIRNEIEVLGSPEGGLMMIYGLYPGVPWENVKAVMDAMERYAGLHA